MALSAAQAERSRRYNAEQARVGRWRPRPGVDPGSNSFLDMVESTQLYTTQPNTGLTRLSVDGALGPNTYTVVVALIAPHRGTGNPDNTDYLDPSQVGLELGRVWATLVTTGYASTDTGGGGVEVPPDGVDWPIDDDDIDVPPAPRKSGGGGLRVGLAVALGSGGAR